MGEVAVPVVDGLPVAVATHPIPDDRDRWRRAAVGSSSRSRWWRSPGCAGLVGEDESRHTKAYTAPPAPPWTMATAGSGGPSLVIQRRMVACLPRRRRAAQEPCRPTLPGARSPTAGGILGASSVATEQGQMGFGGVAAVTAAPGAEGNEKLIWRGRERGGMEMVTTMGTCRWVTNRSVKKNERRARLRERRRKILRVRFYCGPNLGLIGIVRLIEIKPSMVEILGG